MVSNEPRFGRSLETFTERVNGLDELAAAVTPHLDRLRSEPLWAKEVSESLHALPSEKRRTAALIIAELPDLYWTITRTNADIEEVDRLIKSINDKSDGFQVKYVDSQLFFGGADRELREPIRAFAAGLARSVTTPAHVMLLRRSMLTLLVGAFEVLMGELLREHLRMHRSALNSQEKEFSLGDLLEYSSIDEAVEALISSRVDSFTRGGMDEWTKWFGGDSLKVSMSEAAGDWPKTKEVFERRNLVVHHDCRVSQQYLRKVPEVLRSGLSKGDHLDIGEEYLGSAIELVLELGLALGLRVWAKLAKDTEAPGAWIVDTQVDFINRGRPAVALHLGKVFDVSRLPGSTGLIIQVNSWLARKDIEGLESVRAEVERWDVDPLKLLYQVAKNALLDEHEAAAAGIEKLIERKELEIAYLRRWPLFAGVRESGLVDDILNAGLTNDETPVVVDELPPVDDSGAEAVAGSATEDGGDAEDNGARAVQDAGLDASGGQPRGLDLI